MQRLLMCSMILGQKVRFHPLLGVDKGNRNQTRLRHHRRIFPYTFLGLLVPPNSAIHSLSTPCKSATRCPYKVCYLFAVSLAAPLSPITTTIFFIPTKENKNKNAPRLFPHLYASTWNRILPHMPPRYQYIITISTILSPCFRSSSSSSFALCFTCSRT